MNKIKLTRTEKYFWGGYIYQDEEGRYYMSEEGKKPQVVFTLVPEDNPDGEPNIPIYDFEILNPETDKEEKMRQYRFEYMMLSRLAGDFKAFFGNHPDDCRYRNEKQIYGKSITVLYHEIMKYWNAIPADIKPEWLDINDIEKYEPFIGK